MLCFCYDPGSSNGRTAAFEAVNLGSNPSLGAITNYSTKLKLNPGSSQATGYFICFLDTIIKLAINALDNNRYAGYIQAVTE